MPWMQAHRLLSFKYIDRSVIILTEATSIIPVILVIVINFFKGGFFYSLDAQRVLPLK